MNTEFDEFCGAILDQMWSRMEGKGNEYNPGEGDRLRQIRNQARLNNALPQNVIKVLMSKHISRLMDTQHLVTKEELNERGIDCMVYFLLWMWLLEGDDWNANTTTTLRLTSKHSQITQSSLGPILYSVSGWTGLTRQTRLSSFQGHRSLEEE